VKKFFLAVILLMLIAVVVATAMFVAKYGHKTEELAEYNPPQTTYIYDRNGKKIANIFESENRAFVEFDDIPPRVVEALLAIEDTTFFEHKGVNLDAIMRAIIKDIKARKLVEGASTITQQLVKNTLLTREKKIIRKLKEVVFAIKLEMELSKEQILERYFNVIYLGHGYYGIRTAAMGYFHKSLKELSLKEIAILVGLPKAPSFYDPTKNYEPSLGRANGVISRMYSLGWIDETSYKEALEERPKVYDETLTQNQAPYVVDEVLRRAQAIYPDIRSGGYTIYTTIDLPLQQIARDAMRYAYDLALKRTEYNESAKEQLNGALVALDPDDGAVLALVGGVDYTKSSFNRATQAMRQPGSAFKPFLYQTALDFGLSGATELIDISRTYEYESGDTNKKWQPRNYSRDYKGLITLREALVHSKNLATINMVTDIGLRAVISELKRYGFTDLPHDLSLALGSVTMSPLKFAGYYTLFASGGTIYEPHIIKNIDNKLNSWQATTTSKDVIDEAQAYIMTTILQDVVRRGTGRRAKVAGVEVAGKTGTTNNSVDAWFAGYTPDLETIVWFGNDNNTPMYKKETGGRMAGPAFSYFNTEALKLYPQMSRKFKVPINIRKIKYNGKDEYFTDTSPPPKPSNSATLQESLLF